MSVPGHVEWHVELRGRDHGVPQGVGAAQHRAEGGVEVGEAGGNEKAKGEAN